MEKSLIVKNNNGSVDTVNKTEGCTMVPSATIVETPESYILSVDLPGVDRQSITVELEKDELLVEGRLPEEIVTRRGSTSGEVFATGYRRIFHIGDGVNRDSVSALYDNGVLSLTLNKSEEHKPRTITIQ